MIRVPRRAWLVGLGLAAGISLAAGGSTSADAQRRSPNPSVVDQILAQLGANPTTIAPSSVPTCSSPADLISRSPFIILDNQTYAFCPPASCLVFSDVAYCKCDVEFGDSISQTFNYDNGQNVCTVNEEGAATGTYMVSTFSALTSVLKPNGDQAVYTCPGGSDGAYAQCNGGICFTNSEGTSFPGLGELAQNEIICSCPITEQNPRNPVGYQLVGPYPNHHCDLSFFENCNKQTANSHTGSTLYVGAPTGTGRLLTILLTGMNPNVNECFLPRD